jgi:flagellar protein FliO/FliZ
MPLRRSPLSSLFRLLMVAGWALAAAFAAPRAKADSAAPAETHRTPDTVISPKGPVDAPPAETSPLHPDAGVGTGPYVLVVVLLLGAGLWLVWKRRGGEVPFGTKTQKKLLVEETKSLGNRQFLVVASYEEKRFLLGVTAERIQLLSELHDKKEEGQ